jgi:hypothetical protein
MADDRRPTTNRQKSELFQHENNESLSNPFGFER